MTDAQLGRCGKRLEQFLVDLLEPVGRSERRHWGAVYVRGLLLDGERKSIEPMVQRLPDGNEQAMQQFVGQSPWDWKPVWELLARRMVKELEPDAVWVIDDTGFPKQGAHSVGVERQYSGTLGKTANCQVAVSLHEVCTEGAAVLSWRLYLPEIWADDPHGFHEGRGPGKEIWLLVEWPEKITEPTRYFFCDLPADYTLRRLVQVAKSRWKIEQDYQQLKEELGLDHYEGRSWSGWHHHVTLVMLAHSFLTLETLRSKKNFWLDPAEDAT